jgi:hypothetical protein
MSPIASSAGRPLTELLPDPDILRREIDVRDREATVLRRLLRFVMNQQERDTAAQEMQGVHSGS